MLSGLGRVLSFIGWNMKQKTCAAKHRAPAGSHFFSGNGVMKDEANTWIQAAHMPGCFTMQKASVGWKSRALGLEFIETDWLLVSSRDSIPAAMGIDFSIQQKGSIPHWVIYIYIFFIHLMYIYQMSESISLPRWHCRKETACWRRRCKRREFHPWVGKIPWRRAWQPTPVFLPGEYHEQRSLPGYGP